MNPWEKIELSDYENHMKLDSVMQLQSMNSMMKKQFNQYPVKTIMVLGIAGGNGLEHINTQKLQKVYGVDINNKYLKECAMRYKNFEDTLELICADLNNKTALPHADMVIANLLIEYIGYQNFQNAIRQIEPTYVSCIIQINTDNHFVSDSPYIHVFDNLDNVHHNISENELMIAMKDINYNPIARAEQILPNGKKLLQLDFKNEYPYSHQEQYLC